MRLYRLLIIFMMLVGAMPLSAADCPACHATDLPGLVMICPECGVNLHDPVIKIQNQQQASLRIRLLYTGDRPERLPPYGKLYINGIYRGNIDLVEREERGKEFDVTWSDGLGKEYTAVYERIFDQVAPGVLKIEVEMKFARLYGAGRSYKRVVFPYVGFKGGEKTSVEHYFNCAATFNRYKPGKRQPIPILSDSKIQGASGTVAINIGLFE